ncbi:MAG: VIT1/CCC1 transporter family protein [bacterium]|nr:VIT1/CCC1 transporter family protein [bacterium]
MGASHFKVRGAWRSAREIIFGLEDGLVSTLGAVTGIAGATFDSYTIILSGVVLVAVEALSMGVGEYLSSKSKHELWERQMREERREVHEKPEEERAELATFLRDKGVSETDAAAAVEIIQRYPNWMLEEMAVHELGTSPVPSPSPVIGGVYMFFAYILGGSVPLVPYMLFPASRVLIPSIVSTAIVLFLLGAIMGRVTTGRWIRSGCEMAGVSLAAAGLGLLVGRIVTAVL